MQPSAYSLTNNNVTNTIITGVVSKNYFQGPASVVNVKAQQELLVQQTNQQIVNIRLAEINYFISVSFAMANQAVVISGFAYAALTQIAFPYQPTTPISTDDYNNQTITNDDYSLPLASFANYYTVQSLFWVASAICMASSMHVLITSVYIQALGPDLALHGNMGAMAKGKESS